MPGISDEKLATPDKTKISRSKGLVAADVLEAVAPQANAAKGNIKSCRRCEIDYHYGTTRRVSRRRRRAYSDRFQANMLRRRKNNDRARCNSRILPCTQGLMRPPKKKSYQCIVRRRGYRSRQRGPPPVPFFKQKSLKGPGASPCSVSRFTSELA